MDDRAKANQTAQNAMDLLAGMLQAFTLKRQCPVGKTGVIAMRETASGAVMTFSDGEKHVEIKELGELVEAAGLSGLYGRCGGRVGPGGTGEVGVVCEMLDCITIPGERKFTMRAEPIKQQGDNQ